MPALTDQWHTIKGYIRVLAIKEFEHAIIPRHAVECHWGINFHELAMLLTKIYDQLLRHNHCQLVWVS